MQCAPHFIRRFWSVLLLITLSTSASALHGQVEITAHPEDLWDVPIGAEATFRVEATGKGDLRYQWRLNGVNVRGATDATYTIRKVTPRHAGIYTVAVGDDSGFVTSEQAEMTVERVRTLTSGLFEGAHPLSLRGEYRSTNLEAGREADEPLHAGKPGGKSIWFSWTAPLSSSGIATFTTEGSAFDTLLAVYKGKALANLEEIASDDDERGGFLTSKVQFNVVPGEVYHLAVDGFGGAAGEVMLAWEFEPTENFLPEVAYLSPGRTASPGERVDLQVESDALDVEWLHNDQPTGVRGGSFAIEGVTEEDVGSYSVRLRSEGGRELLTTPVRVQIHASDHDTATAPPGSAYTKLVEAAQYALEPPPEPEESDRLLVLSSGPSRGYSSTQIFSTYGSVKEEGEPNHCGEAGGASEWYSYKAPRDGTLHVNTDGSDFDTVLAVYSGPGTSFSTLVPEGCDNSPGHGGDSVRLQAQADRIYWIAVDGVGGATGTVILNMHIGDPVEIQAPPEDATATSGSDVTFSVQATGSPDLQYAWYFGGAQIPGATGSTHTISNASSSDEGSYRVAVANRINSITSPAATLSILSPPEITAHPASRTVNEGDSASFSVSATGTAPLEYQWFRGNDPIAGATEATLTIAPARAEDAGSYSAVVTNTAGSAASNPAVLTVNTPPEITAHPGSRTVPPGGSVVLRVVARATPAPSYQWFYNGGELPGEMAPELTLPVFQKADEGEYKVRVENSLGTEISQTAVVMIDSPARIASFAWHGSDFSLRFIGPAGATYALEGSVDLKSWDRLDTRHTASGFLDFVDPDASALARRFYRVVEAEN